VWPYEEIVMGRFCAGVVGLFLLAAAGAVAEPPAEAKSVKDQVEAVGRAFQKEMGDLEAQFKSAATPEEKAKVREKVFGQAGPAYAKKMMAIATAHPADPAAVDALVFVCSAPGASESKLVPDAVKLLLKHHAGSDQLGAVCQALQRRDDGEKLIRSVRAGATDKIAKLQAGFFMAELLREKEEPTAAESKEAEKLYDEFVTAGKVNAKDIPPEMVQDAEAGLKDLRVFAAGKPAPATDGTDLAGKKVSLADHKGKVVVLDFWATWCGPCVGMIPHERKLVERYAGRPFAFVSVSADDKPEDVTEFLKETPMPWAHWFGGKGDGVTAAWNVRAFPTIYVIDAKGVIRGKVVGGGPPAEKRLDDLVAAAMKDAG
jgi:thiol-disulfide isomerase/thioredoxin